MTVVAVLALARIHIEDRAIGFLDLQEQWVPVVGHHKNNAAAGTHATHTDDLEGEINHAITVKKYAHVVTRRGEVVLEELAEQRVTVTFAQVEDPWRIIDDAAASVRDLSHLDEGRFHGAPLRLSDGGGVSVARGFGFRETALEHVGIESRIPNLKRRHLGKFSHEFAITAHRRAHRVCA